MVYHWKSWDDIMPAIYAGAICVAHNTANNGTGDPNNADGCVYSRNVGPETPMLYRMVGGMLEVCRNPRDEPDVWAPSKLSMRKVRAVRRWAIPEQPRPAKNFRPLATLSARESENQNA